MQEFSWFCPPKDAKFEGNSVEITTHNKTDFWQRTHYGFQNDNGHFLYKKIKGDFTLTAKTYYKSDTLYDQCGIMVRFDADNWIKSSCEYENEKVSHLGAVVTNRGYSDWSTQEIPQSCSEIHYTCEKDKDCFVIRASIDQGKTFLNSGFVILINMKRNSW